METETTTWAESQVDAEAILATFRDLGLSSARDRARFAFAERQSPAYTFQVVISDTSNPQFR